MVLDLKDFLWKLDSCRNSSRNSSRNCSGNYSGNCSGNYSSLTGIGKWCRLLLPANENRPNRQSSLPIFPLPLLIRSDIYKPSDKWIFKTWHIQICQQLCSTNNRPRRKIMNSEGISSENEGTNGSVNSSNLPKTDESMDEKKSKSGFMINDILNPEKIDLIPVSFTMIPLLGRSRNIPAKHDNLFDNSSPQYKSHYKSPINSFYRWLNHVDPVTSPEKEDEDGRNSLFWDWFLKLWSRLLRFPRLRYAITWSFQVKETSESADSVHRSPVEWVGKEFRSSEVPQCPGPNGIGESTASERYPSENMVPEPKVLNFSYSFSKDLRQN